MLSASRTIDDHDIQLAIGLIIRKLRELNKESKTKMTQEKTEDVYKKVSSALKNMAETGLFSKEEMQKYSADWMKGDKFPGKRPIEFVFVINDVFAKEAA